MSSILFNVEEQVAYITLNRPKVYNSVNREMALRLHEILDECEKDDNIRAIYLTGQGKAFCAGQDLQEVTGESAIEITKVVREHYNPIIMRLRNIEKPIIAAVNGVAAGAGANIALACDIVIATESASFIQAFSKIGLIPDSAGTFFLPRLIGFQKASALMMLGDKIKAKQAEELGMIYKSVANEEFEIFTKETAVKLATMPTKGIGLTKRLLNQSMTNNLQAQLAAEDECQTIAGSSYDYKEGVNAFLEKRKPKFLGK